MVAGVCTGVADYFGWDVNLVRLGFGIFSFFYGLGVLAYMIAWVIIPEDGEDSSIAESIMNKRKTPPDPPES